MQTAAHLNRSTNFQQAMKKTEKLAEGETLYSVGLLRAGHVWDRFYVVLFLWSTPNACPETHSESAMNEMLIFDTNLGSSIQFCGEW